MAQAFFEKVTDEAKRRGLLSDEHFTVDGTQIEAWAGQKSFQRKDGDGRQPPDDDRGNPTVNFRGEKRSNVTHESTTDPDARLFTKLKEEALRPRAAAQPSARLEHRHGGCGSGCRDGPGQDGRPVDRG